MCRKTSLAVTPEALGEYLQGMEVRHLPPEYRARAMILPKQEQLVIIQEHGHRSAHWMRWGFVPPWRNENVLRHTPINARAEWVRIKPMFRDTFVHRRGVVVVDGFYTEHRRCNALERFLVHRKDGQLMTLAAIWERRGPEGEPLETCAIITTEASVVIHPIQDRMPVVLTGGSRDRWLDPHTDPVTAERLLATELPDSLVAERYETDAEPAS